MSFQKQLLLAYNKFLHDESRKATDHSVDVFLNLIRREPQRLGPSFNRYGAKKDHV